jgi:cytochrome c oxidase assembly protein subunit 15
VETLNYRWAFWTTLVIGVQIIMGGVVVGKDAGFVCPDWPLCYGSVLPKLSGLVLLELVHRGTALLVTVMVLAIAIVVWRKYSQNRLMVRVATASVISLLLQVVIGGLIVIWQLPGVTTTIDVVNSMVLLGLYVILTMEMRRLNRVSRGVQFTSDRQLKQLAPASVVVMLALACAVLVGAVFRHTGSSEALFGINHYLASHGQMTMPSLLMSKVVLLLHILTGVFAAVASGWFIFQAMRAGRLMMQAWLLFALVGLQMVLGLVSLGTELSFVPVTLHWSNSAVMIALVTWIAFTSQRAVQADMEPAVRSKTVPVPKARPAR